MLWFQRTTAKNSNKKDEIKEENIVRKDLSRTCGDSQRPTLPGQAYPPDVKVTYLYDYCRTNEYFKNIIFDNNNGDNNEDDNNGDIDNENMYTYFGDDDCRRN